MHRCPTLYVITICPAQVDATGDQQTVDGWSITVAKHDSAHSAHWVIPPEGADTNWAGGLDDAVPSDVWSELEGMLRDGIPSRGRVVLAKEDEDGNYYLV